MALSRQEREFRERVREGFEEWELTVPIKEILSIIQWPGNVYSNFKSSLHVGRGRLNRAVQELEKRELLDIHRPADQSSTKPKSAGTCLRDTQCPRCFEYVPGPDQGCVFCGRCGHPLGVECPECARINHPDRESCLFCGADLRQKETRHG